MKQINYKKLILPNIPYVFFVYLFDKVGQAVRLAPGADISAKILNITQGFSAAFENALPSVYPLDLLVGIVGAVIIRLIVYVKGKNAKKYRKGAEYGSARWGTAKDIEPFTAPKFEDNIILTKTERLMMSNRPKNPANARNKNVLIIGGSGSGKTRFWLKPNLLQMHSSYVVTDPKGSIVIECGNALLKHGYNIKIFNTINFKKSMHYNPFAYIHSEKDILKLVTTLIANTKGDGKAGDEFWTKAETLLYCALIGYIHYEAPVEEQNFSTLIEFLNAMEVREDDEEFQNPVDLMFEALEKKKPNHFAVRQYIIGHSQFEKIPLSAERQERQLQEQIDEIEGAIAELKYQRGENFTIKQMEKTRKSLEARLDKLLAADRKDDVITFEQLGVDRLFVDESHAFKNLFLYTKMRNVAGLSTSEAQKSSDMFMKCRYMDEITGGRGVIFATGTPVSNSMTELYTVMRYLQYGTLQKKNLTHFDSWASTFGETTTAIELAPEGTGYRARTRFAKFFNLPELMNMFKEVADIKTSDQLHLPVPEAKFETVVVQPSEYQKDMVASLSERAADVHAGIIDPSVDNMLKITSDGRKLGLDQRLMNPLLPDDPNSKLNACVGNVLRIWQEGQADKLTQLLFCDLSTPKNDGTFNVYDDIKTKLIANGVPAEEVAFIHDADTEAKKKELFAKVRTGQVRVLLGSTQKMGAGTNVQDKLVAVHHLDVGWRPSDMTQRNGRIIRQGNQNKEVQVYQYVTEGTFDAYLYQTLENKQKFISQIMTSKSPVRSCDDVDEQALSYAEIKALCAGNPLIKEKMDLDIDVARLKVLKADHQSQQYRMEDKLLKYFPAEIEKQTGYIHGFEADIKTVEVHPQISDGFCGMEIMGKHYAEKADAGEIILAACKETKSADPVPLGSYRGFQMELSYDSFRSEFDIVLKGSMSHRVALGTDARGNITRLDNALSGIPERLERANEQLTNLYNQQEAAKAELGKPFPQEAELVAKSQRLAELDAALNMEDTVENRAEKSEAERPSVLADLKSKSEHIPPAKRSEGYEEVL